MKRLSIDIETFSECDLKKCGAAVYGEHETTEILCLAWAVDDGPIEIIVPSDRVKGIDWINNPSEYTWCAWNAAFEFEVMSHTLEGFLSTRVELPPLHKWDDTMLRAAANSLPQALGLCAPAMSMKLEKDKDGYNVMMQLCKLDRNGKRITLADAPEKYQTLYDYCKVDVEVERAISNKLPPLSKIEKRICSANFKINQRGVYINADEAQTILDVYMPERDRLTAEAKRLTGLANPNSNTQFHGWLIDNGVSVENVQAATIAEILEEPEYEHVHDAVEVKATIAKTAKNKYMAMLRQRCDSGRVRNSFTYHGAHTGRVASRGVNIQNLHRAEFSDAAACIEVIQDGDIDWLQVLWGDITGITCTLERSIITAEEGNTLLISDYSAIEARVLAWLAGANDVLDVFRTHGKLYEHTAAGIYDIEVDEVTKPQRFVGKVACLALGYGGGAKAFDAMARAYGVKELDEEQAEDIKVNWRQANPNIVNYWYAIQNIAMRAIENSGSTYEHRGIFARVSGGRLRLKLPGGRSLSYWDPRIEEGKFGAQITFMGRDATSGKWMRLHTYGGKLVENITQAVARDILCFALINLEDADFPVVLQVHDEIVCEVPESRSNQLPEMERIMCLLPAWAKGLPLDAEGVVSKRYEKP